MHWVWQTFLAVSWVLALVWLWQAVAAMRGMPTLPDLTRIDPELLPPLPECKGPHLSVIVTARNEERGIDATLRSLLASTGLRIEIIAVDDRSHDRTAEIMDRVAAAIEKGPHRIEVVHVRELPPGWLGKPHAMALAVLHASAPWLLFTDGDVLFAPRLLHIALREATALKADHFILAPTLILKTAWERAMSAAMQALALWTVRMWKVADPRSRDAIGVGGFNMMRREVYDAVGGLEALRMEVLEDVYLGKRVKRRGFSQRIVLGPGLVTVRWIDGAFSVVRLVEKNGFAVCRFRVWLELITCLGLLVDVFWPLVAIAAGGWATAAGVATYIALAAIYHANRRMSGVSAGYVVFFAPAVTLLAFAFLRSMVLALVRGAVEWRGTRYPLDELRRGAKMWR